MGGCITAEPFPEYPDQPSVGSRHFKKKREILAKKPMKLLFNGGNRLPSKIEQMLQKYLDRPSNKIIGNIFNILTQKLLSYRKDYSYGKRQRLKLDLV